jgi:hypothetical protein
MRLVIALLFMIVSVSVARAQSSLQDNLTAKKVPPFSGNLAVGYNSNLYNPDSYSYESSLSADLIANYRVSGANLIRGYFGGSKELTQGQEWNPNDGFVSWVNNGFWMKSSKLIIGQQIRMAVPLSRESRERDTKVTGVSIVPIFIANLTPTLMLIYLPQFERHFHTYKENRLFNKNVEYTMSNLLIGVWSFSEKMYLQSFTSYRQDWSYGGTQRDPRFGFSSEVGYSFPNRMTVALGWSNSGNIRRVEQGVDQSFEAFNNQTSTVYSALYWMF